MDDAKIACTVAETVNEKIKREGQITMENGQIRVVEARLGRLLLLGLIKMRAVNLIKRHVESMLRSYDSRSDDGGYDSSMRDVRTV